MQLTVRDVARLFDVSEKTVYRWIHQGGLPSHRVQEQYRFNRSDLVEWASSRGLRISGEIFAAEDGRSPLPPFSEALQTGGIHHGVGGGDKESALRASVERIPRLSAADRVLLVKVLLAREALASTGIGDGIAIPHARSPILLDLGEPAITLCFLSRAIDFDAIDGRPVDALFTLISPTVRVHLHLLSRLAFALRNPAFKEAVARKASPGEILKAAEAVDSSLPSPVSTGKD